MMRRMRAVGGLREIVLGVAMGFLALEMPPSQIFLKIPRIERLSFVELRWLVRRRE